MEVTRELAKYVISSSLTEVPEGVRHEARRAIVNYVGCAIGGSRHEAVEIAARVLGPYAGAGDVVGAGPAPTGGPAPGLLPERYQLPYPGVLRHDPQELQPPKLSDGLGSLRLCLHGRSRGAGLPARLHPRLRGPVPDCQRYVSRALQRRLAHDGHGWGLRSRRRMGRLLKLTCSR